MTTHATPLTPELYAELVSDLEELKANRNPWADSWLKILDTVEDEEARPPVLAALVRGLPELYTQFREVGVVALRRIVDVVVLADPDPDDFTDLEDLPVGPKPPSVPDHLGALFAPLAKSNPYGHDAGPRHSIDDAVAPAEEE